jgi:hypothetical protein
MADKRVVHMVLFAAPRENIARRGVLPEGVR